LSHRYFAVTYILKADGKYDESVQLIEVRLTEYVNRTASIILDFKTKVVVKSRLDEPLVKDWDLIRNYFYGIYPSIIDDIEKSWEDKKGDDLPPPSKADNKNS
jgi:hypothetical protein